MAQRRTPDHSHMQPVTDDILTELLTNGHLVADLDEVEREASPLQWTRREPTRTRRRAWHGLTRAITALMRTWPARGATGVAPRHERSMDRSRISRSTATVRPPRASSLSDRVIVPREDSAVVIDRSDR